MPKRKGFFTNDTLRPEDDLARQSDVEALLAPRRTVVQDLPLERLRPNPFQARRIFEGLEELATVIKSQGFTTRLRVRPDPTTDGFFQLVYGERRLRAARLAGLEVVPCEVGEHSDQEMLEIGLVENIQRRDLSPLEEGQTFLALTSQGGYSVRGLAEAIGKDKSYVEDRLLLTRVPEDVQQMIVARPDTLRAAREIAKLDRVTDRLPLIEGITSGRLNTENVRMLVKNSLQDKVEAETISDRAPLNEPKISEGAIMERNLIRFYKVMSSWQEQHPTFKKEERLRMLDLTETIMTQLKDFRSRIS